MSRLRSRRFHTTRIPLNSHNNQTEPGQTYPVLTKNRGWLAFCCASMGPSRRLVLTVEYRSEYSWQQPVSGGPFCDREDMPNTEPLRATPAELAAAAEAIRTLLDGLSGGFGSLEADVNTLISSWKGVQGSQFAAGFADVRDGLSELLDAMRDATVALDANSEGYLGQEGANAAAIESVASSLNIPGVS